MIALDKQQARLLMSSQRRHDAHANLFIETLLASCDNEHVIEENEMHLDRLARVK